MTQRPRFLFFFCLLGFLAFPSGTWANGFVKEPGDAYVKLAYSATGNKSLGLEEGAAAQSETSWAARMYGEFGLNLPWTSQVSLATALKSIRRSGDAGESFESRSFADTTVQHKSLVHAKTFLEDTSWPVSFRLASQTSIIVPTTPRRFRTGREFSRYGDVKAGRESLVAPVDDGKWGWSQGFGMSFASQGVWLSLGATQAQDFSMTSPRQTFESQVGLSLPFHSWFQLGFSQSRSSFAQLTQEGNAASARMVDDTLLSSVGLTFWRGLALEAGVERRAPRKGRTESSSTGWTLGVSARSL